MKFGLCPAVGVQKFSKQWLFWDVLGLFWAAATDYAYDMTANLPRCNGDGGMKRPPIQKRFDNKQKKAQRSVLHRSCEKNQISPTLKHPIEIAFSYDNFTFKWANTSCHPPSPSLAMDFGNLPRWKMGEMPWNTIDFVKSLGFFNPPLCTPNCLCPTLCIWMMLCYFCTSFSSWFTFDEIVCAKLFTRNVKLSVTKTPKRKGPWMHDIWQQLLGILPHPDQRVVPSSKTSWIYMNISSTPNSAFKTKEAWTWQCRLKMFDDVSWFFYMAVEM